MTSSAPVTDSTTNSPTVGDGTGASASATIFGSLFGTSGAPASVTLAVGQTLTVSGQLVLTGGGGGDTQYRFGVFNDGGNFASNANYAGGYFHNVSSNIFSAGTDSGSPLSTNGNAAGQSATDVRSGSFDKDSTTAFTYSLAITRDSASTVDIVSNLSGGDGNFSETFTANNRTTTNFTYNSHVWLFGGSSNLNQGSFSNVEFNVVPEPSALTLAAIGLVGIFRRRR